MTAALIVFAGILSVVPGLMFWTFVTFFITFYVLKRVAFGRIQGLIDARRDRIREALDEADHAREEARELREHTRREREETRAERERMLAEARRQAQIHFEQARERAEEDLRRRLDENQRAIEAENRRLREEIRRDVVELTLLATEKVAGKVLDGDDQRRLIDETLAEIDLNAVVSQNGG